MKIGYPCINYSITSHANKTFRLKNYSEAKLIETVNQNLLGLQAILSFNLKQNLFFFRISSDLIPFASHPICYFDWQKHFKEHLELIGAYIKRHNFRISMHPDQFVLINAHDPRIVQKSIGDLAWHCQLLDSLTLDNTAKVQIHVGGIYGDKKSAIKRFIQNYKMLPNFIQKRLVIENDDRLFSLQDCLNIHHEIGIPVIFDNLHHACLHQGESLDHALSLATKTWSTEDGLLMVDYSSQEANARIGKHATTLDEKHFTAFLKQTKRFNFDLMLEIKDKETSAVRALSIAKKLKIPLSMN